MTPEEHEQVINELQVLIDDTHATLKRFEHTGMDYDMPDEHEKLLTILNDAVKQQREHTQLMLRDNES